MKLAPVTLAAALFAAPAIAGTAVPVSHFDQISLNGGGHVVVKHGAAQSVTLLKGDTQHTRFSIRHGNELVIDACAHDCMGRYDLEIEIVTPELNAAAIDGGGEIDVASGFPATDDFAVAIEGGGSIDTRALSANKVSAAVDGGGDIQVNARRELSAAVEGGGSITYLGNPEVSSAIDGGGEVSKARS